MSRSKWKGPFTHFKINVSEKKNHLKHCSRHAKITPTMLNKIVFVHSGNDTVDVEIKEEMLGHSFGEFTATRKKFYFKKRKPKK